MLFAGRARPTYEQHGTLSHLRVLDCSDGVGEARSCSHSSHTHAATHASHSISCEHSSHLRNRNSVLIRRY